MAIQNNDLVVLQQTSTGTLRKATVAALLNEVTVSTPTLQDVTAQGNSTTNDIITGTGSTQIKLDSSTGEISGGADSFIDCGTY
tara:strand:- start:765 stop:1016 length:252 start_codon:yes stop_codon:yes gene_type:complete